MQKEIRGCQTSHPDLTDAMVKMAYQVVETENDPFLKTNMLEMAIAYATTDQEWQHNFWTTPIKNQQKEFWEKQLKKEHFLAPDALFYLNQIDEEKDADNPRKKMVDVYKMYLSSQEAPQTVGESWAHTCAWHYMFDEVIKTNEIVSRDADVYAHGMFMMAHAMTLPLEEVESENHFYSAKDLFYQNKHIARAEGLYAFSQFKKIAAEANTSCKLIKVLGQLIQEGLRA